MILPSRCSCRRARSVQTACAQLPLKRSPILAVPQPSAPPVQSSCRREAPPALSPLRYVSARCTPAPALPRALRALPHRGRCRHLPASDPSPSRTCTRPSGCAGSLPCTPPTRPCNILPAPPGYTGVENAAPPSGQNPRLLPRSCRNPPLLPRSLRSLRDLPLPLPPLTNQKPLRGHPR